MKLKINGIEKTVDVASLSIRELLIANEVQSPDMVSVQLNGSFVKNEVFERTFLNENDEIDFLYFMGGGSNYKK
jgi:sulfur carrier protein